MTSTINDMLKARSALDPFGRPSAEQVSEFTRIKAALDQEARDNWDNPSWHREISAIVAERLDYGFLFENLFGTYFQVRSVPEFETVELRERRGLQVFWTARGGYIDETQLTTERWTLPRDTVGFHVSEFEDKLRFGFAETMEELISLAMMRLDAEINRRMFNLMQAAIPSSSAYYVDAAAGLTLADVNESLAAVNDAIRPSSGGTRPPVTIAGRRTMIDKFSEAVTDVAALYDPEATAEIRRQGRLGSYRGANIVQIQNYTDENDLSYIPENELWVFGGTVGLFCRYGGMKSKSWDENTSDYRHYRGRLDVGGIVHHPEVARRIVDGTV